MKLNEIKPEDEAVLSEGLLSTAWKITKMAVVAVATILLTRAILGFFEKKAIKQQKHDDALESAQYIAYIGLALTREDEGDMPRSDIRTFEKYAHAVGSEIKEGTPALEAYVEIDDRDKETVTAYVAFLLKEKRDASKIQRKLNQVNKKLNLKWQFLKVKRM